MPGQIELLGRHLERVTDEAGAPSEPCPARHCAVGRDLPGRNGANGAPDRLECRSASNLSANDSNSGQTGVAEC